MEERALGWYENSDEPCTGDGSCTGGWEGASCSSINRFLAASYSPLLIVICEYIRSSLLNCAPNPTS